MSERTRGHIRVYVAGIIALTAMAVALAAAAPVRGQQAPAPPAAELQPPVVWVGGHMQYARPVGEFRDYVEHGFGVDLHVVWPVGPESALALRGDGGFLVYGSETKRVCFSGTVGCRVLLDLTTTNTIAYLNVGPQLMLHSGPVRPYANAGVGFSYFATTSQVEGTGSQETVASTTNFDDITLAWTVGSGAAIPLSSGATPVSLDLGVRYHGNGEVEYLKKGDITDHPDGSITISPTRSAANLLTFQIGITAGLRRSRPQ
jgi:opacity protein-like surface antigen